MHKDAVLLLAATIVSIQEVQMLEEGLHEGAEEEGREAAGDDGFIEVKSEEGVGPVDELELPEEQRAEES